MSTHLHNACLTHTYTWTVKIKVDFQEIIGRMRNWIMTMAIGELELDINIYCIMGLFSLCAYKFVYWLWLSCFRLCVNHLFFKSPKFSFQLTVDKFGSIHLYLYYNLYLTLSFYSPIFYLHSQNLIVIRNDCYYLLWDIHIPTIKICTLNLLSN